MNRFQKLAVLVVFTLIGGTFLLSGCTRKFTKQTLDQKRLGVYLKTEKGDRAALNNALTAWLSQTLTTTGITTIPTGDWDGTTRAACHKIRRAYQLDYLAVVRLTEVKIKGAAPRLDIFRKSINLKLGSKCQLDLSYRIINLRNGKVMLAGQTSGAAEKNTDLHLGLKKIAINLQTDEQDQLIAAAMLNAVENSTFFQ
jgi:hypothetical protein